MNLPAPACAAPVQARPAIQDLGGSLIREVANAGMGRPDVLPFWFGESDQPTPHFIRDAAIQSLATGETFYSENLGRPWLRAAIAQYLQRLHGRAFEVGRIAAVASGDMGLMLANQLLLSPGDRAVAVTPLWPNLLEMPRILGAQVERVPLQVQGGRWHLDVDRLLDALAPGTRLLILNSPNNPTGWTLQEGDVAPILAHCRRHGIWVLSDDVYERLVYEPTLASAPSLLRHSHPEDRIVSVNSCSKAWLMTGWRMGWMVVPAALEAALAKVIEYNFSCIFEPVQRAAAVALAQGEAHIAQLRAGLVDSRRLLVQALRAVPGVQVPDAGGAMYVFFRLQGQPDSLALAKRLVREAGLGLAPGSAFGPEGQGWLRWCHATADTARLLEGVRRLEHFVRQTGAQQGHVAIETGA